MKSPWPVMLVVAAIALLRIAQANSDEPESAPAPRAADPMRSNAPGDARDDNGLKMKLVWCPPGFVTMENVEVIEELGREHPQLIGKVVYPRDAGPTRIDDQRPDPFCGVFRQMARHGNTDGGALRLAVVERDDQRPALKVAIAGRPGDRRYR